MIQIPKTKHNLPSKKQKKQKKIKKQTNKQKQKTKNKYQEQKQLYKYSLIFLRFLIESISLLEIK